LLAVVAFVGRLREVRAGVDNGGGRCLEMLPCLLEPAGSGNRAGVGGVPGGEPGTCGPSAGPANTNAQISTGVEFSPATNEQKPPSVP